MFDQWLQLVAAEFEKPGYREVEKAQYTITLLEGEPRKIVTSLKDPTYDDIIKVFENKYGDVLVRIQKAVLEIAESEHITTFSVKDLDPLYNKLLSNWNYVLKKTNDDINLKNSSWLLTALVHPKLPKVLIHRWDSEKIKDEQKGGCQNSNIPIPFDELLVKLQETIQVARRTDTGTE